MTILLLVLVAVMAGVSSALHSYGHAFSRPGDFTDEQIKAIASRFEVFTVEKATAVDVYGNHSSSAKPPFTTNSYAATVGTAKKIKAINPSVKVLMYWNSALYYNMYECESEVLPSWTKPNRQGKPPLFDYTVPAFRKWWVTCAIDCVLNSSGLVDGLFLDATPKVADHLDLWGEMVEQIRAALGEDAFVINNGFYNSPTKIIAGPDAWNATGLTYIESLANVGNEDSGSSDHSINYLLEVASDVAKFPKRTVCGHGTLNVTDPALPDTLFEFGLAKYMMVTTSMENGWFLANTNYSIDGGLLVQPTSVYSKDGFGCGEPTTAAVRVGRTSTIFRAFEHGNVSINFDNNMATINCKN